MKVKTKITNDLDSFLGNKNGRDMNYKTDLVKYRSSKVRSK